MTALILLHFLLIFTLISFDKFKPIVTLFLWVYGQIIYYFTTLLLPIIHELGMFVLVSSCFALTQ